DIVVRLTSPANLGALSLSTFTAGASSYDPLALDVTTAPVYGQGREIFGDFTIHDAENLTLDLDGDQAGILMVNASLFTPATTVTNQSDVPIHAPGGSTDFYGVVMSEDNINFDLRFVNATGAAFALTVDSPVSASIDAIGASVRHFTNGGSYEI